MLNITVANKFGDLYQEAIKRANVSCLMEINDGFTVFTIHEEDLKEVNKQVVIVRASMKGD